MELDQQPPPFPMQAEIPLPPQFPTIASAWASLKQSLLLRLLEPPCCVREIIAHAAIEQLSALGPRPAGPGPDFGPRLGEWAEQLVSAHSPLQMAADTRPEPERVANVLREVPSTLALELLAQQDAALAAISQSFRRFQELNATAPFRM